MGSGTVGSKAGGSQMFRSLRERNAKLFFAGLAVSNVGTWLQATAQVLLVRASAATAWRSASSPPASSSRCC